MVAVTEATTGLPSAALNVAVLRLFEGGGGVQDLPACVPTASTPGLVVALVAS